MIGKEFNAVIDKNLFPIVPLFDYLNRPYTKWGIPENRIKNVSEFKSLPKKDYTGFSLIGGSVSGIMVLDIDVNHGDSSIDGKKSFDNLISNLPEEDRKAIFDTFSVKTPRGGIHLYFRYKKGLKSKANYVEGVDIKTDGGLIILPGTQRRIDNGSIEEYKVLNDVDIRKMPQSLFHRLMDIIKPIKKVLPQVEKNSVKEITTYREGTRNQELFKEVIGIVSKSSIRDIGTITSIARGLNLLKCVPPLDNNEVDNIIGSITQRVHPCYCDNKGNIDNWNLIQYIIKQQPSYTKGNLWYLYNAEKGFYDYMELKDVQKMFFKYAINNKDKTVIKSKNFAELLMLNSEDARNAHDEKRYINCLDGVIDIETDELLPHNPKYKLQVQFHAHYIKDWKEKFNNSEFKKFLNSTLDESSILTLQESWGLMLSPHSKEVQQCFIYKGEGSNGKSAAFDIQEALINDNRYICSIGLGDFGEPFVISMAEGKYVNIVRDDELSGKTVHKFFKSMICSEPVLVNRKNKDLVRLGFNMTYFFGLNRLPSVSDKSTGFFRRQIIIPFNISFGTEKEVERGLRDKVKDTGIADRIIKNELDIVFMWSFEGLKRVKANKWKVTVSAAAEQEMEEYREEVDSAYSFFKVKIVSSPKKDTRILKDKVYKCYLEWCYSNDITPMNKIQFGRQFKSFGIKEKISNSLRYWVDIDIFAAEEVENNENPFD